MNRFFLFLIFLICLLPVRVLALYPVPFQEKANASGLIVEARVQKGQPFWNATHTMIFTAWNLDIYKVFKGDLPSSPVQVLTQGGIIGDEGIVASDLLQLEEGSTGVFFLFQNTGGIKAPDTGLPLFDVYSSAQGFLKYAEPAPGAYAPFARYENIETDLYPVLQKLKAGKYKEVKPRPVTVAAGARRGTGSVTTFTPQHVHAGAHNDPANNTLTVTGTGFGTPSGSAAIAFDNADDGTAGSATTLAYNNILITSWTTTQIVVKVPASAGTGTVNIYDNTGALAASFSLTVDYAVMAADFGNGPQEVNMMNTNGSGGYSISYSTNTAGSGVDMTTSSARETFQRALATHKQTGGVNFSDSTGAAINTTTSQAINAGTLPNLVEFDNSNTGLGSPMAAGVLAVCYSGYSRCTGSQVRRSGFDILLRNPGYSTGTTTFTNGPCPPAETSTNDLDLETVILLELGHAINEGHVIDDYQYGGGGFSAINPAAVMNYALVNGVRRSSYDNALLMGVQYSVTPKGLSYGNCVGFPFTEMTPLTTIISARDECSGLFPAPVPTNGATIAFDLVHATANKNTDPQYTALRSTSAGTNVTNTQYYAFTTTAAGGSVTMAINNYGTTPTAQASCINSGVEMALYSVNTCPVGQSYPTPVAHRLFKSDTTLAAFTGLAGNTSYLLIADGLENTKATFNAIITSGTALPITLLSFQGSVAGMQNLLSWQFGSGQLPQSFLLERSRDGKNFVPVYTEKVVLSDEGHFTDVSPYPGNNYYRLRLADKSGSVEYSKVVALLSGDNSRLSLAPVPARNSTNLYYNAAIAGKITATLFHSSGQIAAQWDWVAFTGANTFLLDLNYVAAGSYILRINTGNNEAPVYLKLQKQ